MRTNLPVVNQEYPFPKGKSLVSTTDTKGRILYCNEAFLEVSGFEKDELLGQPHNIVRHPDMPEEAYRDMWASISAGHQWTAPVKNRRKDGTFYWVLANATPIMNGGKPVGYMSVRTEATRQQIEQAEALYARMREEKQAGRLVTSLERGAVQLQTLGGKLKRFLSLSLSGRFAAVLIFLIALRLLGATILEGAELLQLVRKLVIEGIAAAGVYWYLIAKVIRPLDRMNAFASQMAGADLTGSIEVTGPSQIGALERALNQLNLNLRSIVSDVRIQTHGVTDGTLALSQGNQDLSQRTETQASNLEETAASIEEITGTVKQTAESAATASQLAAKASDIAYESQDAVTQVGSRMDEIQKAAARIASITQVIDGIAFQTNILALNAAVEAARAGEQGKGFAVVAGEVRSLAQRAAAAAKDIKSLIDESTVKVGAGLGEAKHAQSSMQQAVEGIDKVVSLVNEISSACREQMEGITQINAAVSQLDGITQQNAALVEEVAASATHLSVLSTDTQETIGIFQIDSSARPVSDAVALRRKNK